MKNLRDLHRAVPQKGSILDIGCLGFLQKRLADSLGRTDVRHYGVDYGEAEKLPDGFTFKTADLNTGGLPFDDDSFDLVVATHVIEHLHRPVEFFGECIRVCRPGGYLYFASPSDRSVWIPSYPFDPTRHVTLSFYDDPTHCGRPFSPQSYVRLAIYYGCTAVASDYEFSWPIRLAFPVLLPFAMLLGRRWLIEKVIQGAVGWIAYAIVQKPISVHGGPAFRYEVPEEMMAPSDGLYRFFGKVSRAIRPGSRGGN